MKYHYNLFKTVSRSGNIPGRVVVTRAATIIKVSAAYNKALPHKAHMLGGHFNRDLQEWIFPLSKEKQVQQLFTSTFGVWDTIPERR